MTGRLFAPVLALTLAATSVAAQRPPSTGEALQVHPEARAAIDQIRSPYCPGQMLDVCSSSGGAMLRDSIQRMAERGMSSDSIVELIIAEYGERWRAEPLRSGTGLFAWLLPPAVLILGLGGVGLILAHRRRGDGAVILPEAPEVDAEDEERLRAALKKLEEEEEPVF